MPGEKIVAIVKQGEATISPQYQTILMNQILELGGTAPIFIGARGSFALLGYRRTIGRSVTWTRQVAKFEGGGISEIRTTITYSGNQVIPENLQKYVSTSRSLLQCKTLPAHFSDNMMVYCLLNVI